MRVEKFKTSAKNFGFANLYTCTVLCYKLIIVTFLTLIRMVTEKVQRKAWTNNNPGNIVQFIFFLCNFILHQEVKNIYKFSTDHLPATGTGTSIPKKKHFYRREGRRCFLGDRISSMPCTRTSLRIDWFAPYSSTRPGENQPFLQIVLVQTGSDDLCLLFCINPSSMLHTDQYRAPHCLDIKVYKFSIICY